MTISNKGYGQGFLSEKRSTQYVGNHDIYSVVKTQQSRYGKIAKQKNPYNYQTFLKI